MAEQDWREEASELAAERERMAESLREQERKLSDQRRMVADLPPHQDPVVQQLMELVAEQALLNNKLQQEQVALAQHVNTIQQAILSLAERVTALEQIAGRIG